MDPIIQTQNVQPSSNKALIVTVAASILSAAIVGGGVYTWQYRKSQLAQDDLQAQINTLNGKLATPTPTVTPVATSTPTPTPTATAAPTQKTYTNTELGSFSFSYPTEYSVIEDSGPIDGGGGYRDIEMVVTDKKGLVHRVGVKINASSTYNINDLDALLKDWTYEQTTANLKDLTLKSGMKAKQWDDGGGLFGTTYTTLTTASGIGFRIAIDPYPYANTITEEEKMALYNAILDSFKAN